MASSAGSFFKKMGTSVGSIFKKMETPEFKNKAKIYALRILGGGGTYELIRNIALHYKGAFDTKKQTEKMEKVLSEKMEKVLSEVKNIPVEVSQKNSLLWEVRELVADGNKKMEQLVADGNKKMEQFFAEGNRKMDQIQERMTKIERAR